MRCMTVRFNNPKEVLDFVNRLTRYPFDADIRKGHILIDAKSVLGILALGMGGPLELLVYSDQCDGLEQEIGEYLAAGRVQI